MSFFGKLFGTNAGGRQPNPSMATILMPTTSFAQLRADRQADLAYTQALFQLEQQNLTNKQAEEKKVRDAFNYVNSLDLLKPDKDRLQALSDGLEQKIIDKIKNKYGGNIRKYMREEGEVDLYDFKQQLITSEYMRQAMTNKTNKGNYDINDVDGKVHRKVSWTTIDGKKKTGSFEEAFADYMNFQTQSLSYNGGYDPPKKAHEYFSKTYSPRGHYAGDEPLPEEVFAAYLGEGMSPEDAADFYDRFYMKGMYRYKADSSEDYNLKVSKMQFDIAKERAKQEMWNKNWENRFKLEGMRQAGANSRAQMRANSSKGSGDDKRSYDFFSDKINKLYDKDGNLIEGESVFLHPAGLDKAMGADTGKERIFASSAVRIKSSKTNDLKDVKMGTSAVGRSTGTIRVIDGIMHEEVKIRLNYEDAIKAGLRTSDGWFSSGSVNEDYETATMEDDGSVTFIGYVPFMPNDAQIVTYDRGVSGVDRKVPATENEYSRGGEDEDFSDIEDLHIDIE